MLRSFIEKYKGFQVNKISRGKPKPEPRYVGILPSEIIVSSSFDKENPFETVRSTVKRAYERYLQSKFRDEAARDQRKKNSTSESEEVDPWVVFWNQTEEKLESNEKNVAKGAMVGQQEKLTDRVAEGEFPLEGELEKLNLEEIAQKFEFREQQSSDYAAMPTRSHAGKESFLHLKQFARFSAVRPDKMFEEGEKIFHVGFMQQQRMQVIEAFPKREAALVRMHKQLIARWQKKAVEEKNKHLSEEECKMLQEYNLTMEDPDVLKKSERMIEVIHETVWPLIADAYRDFKDACCYGKLCLTKLYNFKPDLYEEALEVVRHLTEIHLSIETMMNDQVDYYLKRAGLVTDIDGEMNAIHQTYTLSKYDDAERERCQNCVQRLARYYDESRILILKCLIQPVDDIELTAAALKNAKTPMDLFVISKQMNLD